MAKHCFGVTCVGDDLPTGTEITNDRSRGVHQRLSGVYFSVSTESGLSSIVWENTIWERLNYV